MSLTTKNHWHFWLQEKANSAWLQFVGVGSDTEPSQLHTSKADSEVTGCNLID